MLALRNPAKDLSKNKQILGYKGQHFNAVETAKCNLYAEGPGSCAQIAASWHITEKHFPVLL